jgi:hypothetical protein
MDLLQFAERMKWPISFIIVAIIVAIVGMLIFRQEIVGILRRITGLTIDLFKGKAAITIGEAETVLDQMGADIDEVLKGLDQRHLDLFKEIRLADGKATTDEIVKRYAKRPFVFESTDHERLRALRRRSLIRPNEGSNWTANKHPVLTQWARIVLRKKSDAFDKPRAGG